MKRTKSMIYRKTQESRELFIYATNTGEIYPQTCAIIRKLAKKYAKGVYDADKAIDEIMQLPDTDDFYLHIADLPLKADKE